MNCYTGYETQFVEAVYFLEKQLIWKAIYVKREGSDHWELREDQLKKWRKDEILSARQNHSS